MTTDSPTRFIELTSRGRGAVSVVALSGPESRVILAQCFTPFGGRPFDASRPIAYGTWNSTGEDLVLATSGTEAFEIQCHGGLAAVAAVKHSLQELGAVEVSDRANWMISQGRNQWELELQESLIQSQTERTAGMLLQQFDTATTFLANAAQICNSADPKQIQELIARSKSALEWSRFGLHLTTPWSVVLCGQPNVGKSSLINRLVGFKRSIVHETAGTTRDILSQQTAIDGWPVAIKDTAGLRSSKQNIEKIGIEKAILEIEKSDAVFLVVDATNFESAETENQIADLKPDLLIINKVDLVSENSKLTTFASQSDTPSLCTSAVENIGIEEIESAISKCLIPTAPPDGQLIPTSATHETILRELIIALESDRLMAAIKIAAC